MVTGSIYEASAVLMTDWDPGVAHWVVVLPSMLPLPRRFHSQGCITQERWCAHVPVPWREQFEVVGGCIETG